MTGEAIYPMELQMVKEIFSKKKSLCFRGAHLGQIGNAEMIAD